MRHFRGKKPCFTIMQKTNKQKKQKQSTINFNDTFHRKADLFYHPVNNHKVRPILMIYFTGRQTCFTICKQPQSKIYFNDTFHMKADLFYHPVNTYKVRSNPMRHFT